eukprot:CAMPEP_0168626580 /NCGR_PEP_ID=MMETSP0449_2-20121227/10719_1 /TAXON_ID=1082188 /ORGANISM="Strombidium rassoulzadegani, Strain ras09" /LENGTH=193 /DNA_ID=CAMNT_0008668607 /DNA_START=6 /DNA_END=583 /DNA_ORIENTATION=-
MSSLIDMQRSYKEKETNVKEEIQKLTQLSLIKDDEIVNLDIELKSLSNFLDQVRETQTQKIELYKSQIEDNKKVIKRQDKLIVDLQQRNELSMNEVAVTQDQVSQKVKQQDTIQIKMRELSDQRDFFCGSISNLEERIQTFRSYIQTQNMNAGIANRLQQQNQNHNDLNSSAMNAQQSSSNYNAPKRRVNSRG